MMTSYDRFVQLHHQDHLFLLGNAWDAASAKIFENNRYQAVGTSSAAVAEMFGYHDGENIEFEDLLFIVKKIVRAVKIPLTVDIESGYSVHLNEMALHVEQLYEVGVAGINIEDSSSKNGKVEMDSTDEFCRKLYFLKNYLERKHMKIFINARTDAYLLQLQNSFQITSERITAYEKAGADGLFVPYLKKKDEISVIVQSTKLPVNLLAAEDLPPFHLISQLGVKRISMGPSAFRYLQKQFERITKRVKVQHSFAPLYEIENQISIAS